MGDMPCIWCLLFVGGQYYGDGKVYTENPADSEAVPHIVRSWADAEDAVRAGLVVRDHNKVRCGLIADTLIGGDAVCRGHALVVVRQRIG